VSGVGFRKSERGPRHLGDSSKTINLLAVVWTALICTIMVLPPNTRAGLRIAAVILVLFAPRRLSGEHKVRRTP
jgi:hypothetical protein